MFEAPWFVAFSSPLAWFAAAALVVVPLASARVRQPGGAATLAPSAHTHPVARGLEGAFVISLALAAFAGVGLFLGAQPAAQGLAPFSLQLTPVTVTLWAMVALLGFVLVRYSRAQLEGDPRQRAFLNRLGWTLAAVQLAILTDHLIVLWFAWIAMSVALRSLILYAPERPGAQAAAAQMFRLDRVADLLLLAAILLLGRALGTFQISGLGDALAASTAGALDVTAAVWLLVGVVVVKMAQFPLHGWLTRVVEAPTPVSALLHAGIINAPAVLAIRLSDVLVTTPGALVALGVVGLVSVVVASLVLITQSAIKNALVWSTVAQMGFVLLEIALGLFTLALLHIVAHSLYKAHAFLASGSVVDDSRGLALLGGKGKRAARAKATPGAAGALREPLLLATLIVGGIGGLWLTGGIRPETAAVAAIVTAALGQWWIGVRASGEVPAWRALVVVVAFAVAYVALHLAFKALAGPVTATLTFETTAQAALLVLVLLAFALLPLAQRWLETATSPRRTMVWIALHNGLYADAVLSRSGRRPRRSPARETRLEEITS